MKNNMAYCGLDCARCQAYLATQNDDDNERQKVADMWSKAFKMDFKKEDVNCDGCHTPNGRLFSYCQNCEVRRCGVEKTVDTCAHCDTYSCKKLDTLLTALNAPEARDNLDTIKQNL